MRKGLLAAFLIGAVAYTGFAQKNGEDTKPAPSAGNILLVVTNHGRLGDTNKPTGYWMSEVSHAWTRFTDAGYDVTFASPRGGVAPADPRSFDMDDQENSRMWSKRPVVEQIAATKPLAEVDASKYDAIYFAGGHGTMWDFPGSEPLQKVTQQIYENGGVVSAVCHGPAALVNVKTADGEYLVKGKKVAGFTNEEEMAAGLADAVPFLLQSKLHERGATVETAPNYQEKVVTDGRLVTGQNPASAAGTAEKVLRILKENKQ
jgi:putative intracellular protease/amidase